MAPSIYCSGVRGLIREELTFSQAGKQVCRFKWSLLNENHNTYRSAAGIVRSGWV